MVRFPVIAGVPTAPPGERLALQQTVSGFTLTDENDTAEQYDTTGRLWTSQDFMDTRS